MNNLHRDLAPISDAAWAEIEEETSRTIKRHLAGRRVVDVQGPSGTVLSAIGTATCGRSRLPRKACCSPTAGGEIAGRTPHSIRAQASGD